MEAYIIIISVAISAIAIAYKISNNIKNNNIIPFVIVDGVSGISFPVGVPNDISLDINANNRKYAYLKIKEINPKDIKNFSTISNNIDWQSILENILNKKDLVTKSYFSDIQLYNVVIIECLIECETPIMAEVQFLTDNSIKIKWK
jgi:hypothetical protein